LDLQGIELRIFFLEVDLELTTKIL
jgi:hypothetical protein